MTDKSEGKLPSGIVKFTIARDELKNILSKKYNVDVESFSAGEEGVTISLQTSGKGELEEEAEEKGETNISGF
ncbi:hypothetical protein AKJ40_03150 [candidate division MSBL1 archaeon SCGC-AAA259M10]|uniref:Uncharacterized protein n=1 Tax=candidate division MSBL1 archaeon SCGC-AAA259M10 TaxID=1698270 RepID=A0A133UZ18_9EURY|nr:hypothetical protein AKJ40_03150 [candidate division MSBL1 archaeon SCGC-AAA259M10]